MKCRCNMPFCIDNSQAYNETSEVTCQRIDKLERRILEVTPNEKHENEGWRRLRLAKIIEV